MNILIIGSGGREHALAWKIKQSPKCEMLFIAPGNTGTALLGENVALDIKDTASVVRFAKEKNIGLVVVGPDDVLAQGLIDELSTAGISAFGPTKASAKLEWSKAYAKAFMKKYGIPCADSETFTVLEDAIHFGKQLISERGKAVIKADGLALGKGVVIADSDDDVDATLSAFMKDNLFGESGTTVVIEEFLEGKEVSAHAFCDGDTATLFPLARDHKRIHDGNSGLNTGGMGTIAPVRASDAFMSELMSTVISPVMRGMKDEGTPFKGVLFPGIMVTETGIKVLEFNARFGDPECESFMRLLDSDIVPIMEACIAGTLSATDVKWKNTYATTVILASKGYPSAYEKGKPISGLDMSTDDTGIVIFHAGTKKEGDVIVTNGGRVLAVSALGSSPEEAKNHAYEKISSGVIAFDNAQFRTDIGADWDV